jgi:hypothetical protein
LKTKAIFCIPLMFMAPLFVQAGPVLITGTPADDSTLPNTPVSLHLGGAFINFDGLPSCQTFPPAGCTNYSGTAFSGVTISSPDGLFAIPFSGQSAPNELYDASAEGSANITLSLNFGTGAIGVGIADSDVDGNGDPVQILLQALDVNGANLGSAFDVTIPEINPNPGNGYFVLADTTSDIFGLRISQSVGDPNFSGLAIDDVQVAPEPSTFVLLITGVGIFGSFRMRKRS